MSKNTERGIGLQGGPADGQTAESAASGDLPKPDEAPRTDRPAGEPQRSPADDSRPATLLGVPSPLSDREKVTALGRDVHLPFEAHRVASSRPIAVQEVRPGPVTARGSGAPSPESAPERAHPEPVHPAAMAPVQPAAMAKEGDLPGALNARPVEADRPLPERAETIASTARPTHPANRATTDASPHVVSEESSEESPLPSDAKERLRPTLGPSIALGIGMALVLSIVLVSIVRFASLDEGDEEPVTEETAAPPGSTPPPKQVAAQNEGSSPALTNAVATAGTSGTASGTASDSTAGTIGTTTDSAAGTTDSDEPKAEALPPSPLAPGKEDARHAPSRTRVVGPTKRPPGASVAPAATGGNGNPGGGPGITPITPPKAAAPNQPYDPDSPLPPAGE